MTVTLHRLYIGTNDKNTKQPAKDMTKFFKVLKQVLNDLTEGYTMYHATGYYKHDDDTTVQEGTVIIELINYGGSVYALTAILKDRLNQESIYVTEQEINAKLY